MNKFLEYCYNGKVNDLISMLRAGIDPTMENHIAIQYAVESNNSEVVKILLNDGRVDPTINNYRPINAAIASGNLAITKLLLNDKRIDPTYDNNSIFARASYYGQIEIVKLLFSDSRIDPSANNNEAIGWAYKNNHNNLYGLLFSDERVLSAIDSMDNDFNMIKLEKYLFENNKTINQLSEEEKTYIKLKWDI